MADRAPAPAPPSPSALQGVGRALRGLSSRLLDPLLPEGASRPPSARPGSAAAARPPSPARAAPSVSALDGRPHVVVGVLERHVSALAGWRPRLFVLHAGVLRCYKIGGPPGAGPGAAALLDALAAEAGGELYTVGAQVSVLEERDRAAARDAAPRDASFTAGGGATPAAAAAPRLPPPSLEVHAQLASARPSAADARRFYVNSGTATLALRAETADDRGVWLAALAAASRAWRGLTPLEGAALTPAGAAGRGAGAGPGRVRDADDDFLGRLAALRRRLGAAGAPEPAAEAAEDALLAEHQLGHAQLVAEEEKRRALLGIIYSLEDQKRQLETALVVEATRGAGAAGKRASSDGRRVTAAALRPLGTPPGGSAAGASEGDDDDDGDDDAGGGASPGPRAPASEVPDDDEFFECETASAAGAAALAHSRQASLTEFSALAPDGDGAAAGSPPGAPAAAPAAPGAAPGAAPDGAPAGGLAPPPPEPAWVAAEGPPPARRVALPRPAQPERSVSLWSLIKEMVGRDLTRVCLPVYFNEPLSALQKTAEDLEYCSLLDDAARRPAGGVERLLLVAAFAVSAYSSTVGRTAKPFNPLLGETYELVAPERGLRFIAEKVSHHPTIIAAHAEGRGWALDGDAEIRSRFWGRSIELRPDGVLRATFADGEVYAWNKVTTSINNLVLGKLYVDHGGVMRVRRVAAPGGGAPPGAAPPLACRVRFREAGLFDREPRAVAGFVERPGGGRFERPALRGRWDAEVVADMPGGGEPWRLWAVAPPPPDPTRYRLTAFAITLNEVTPGLAARLAPTDCRLRPDQRLTEQGRWDAANAEKQRLEHKQRAARAAADAGVPLAPRWFEDVRPAGGGHHHHHRAARGPDDLAFRYKGGYWEERAAGHFTGCRDIFGA